MAGGLILRGGFAEVRGANFSRERLHLRRKQPRFPTMEEIEVPTEHLHEHLEHEAEHGAAWISWVAVSTAIIAAIAAVASLLAGGHVNEAMVSKMDSNDKWSEFGVKSIKADLAAAKGDEAKVKDYEAKKDKLMEEAKKLTEESEHHLKIHERLAASVTFCQIAIALAAISALTKRRPFWYVSLIFGIGGAVLMGVSLF
jgi:uncharacterized protein DUF4337